MNDCDDADDKFAMIGLLVTVGVIVVAVLIGLLIHLAITTP